MIRRTLRQTQAATFSIDLPNPTLQGMPFPNGTGFFISPDGWFVTAAHVVCAEDSSGKQIPRNDLDQAFLAQLTDANPPDENLCQFVSLEYLDLETDFALLRVDFQKNAAKEWLKGRSGFPYIQVSKRPLVPGEPVYAFGYPLPRPENLSGKSIPSGDLQVQFSRNPNMVIGGVIRCPRTTSAIVASDIKAVGSVVATTDPISYVLDKALNYGNSGGPILSSETGKVHALCSEFQPVGIPQPQLSPDPSNPISIVIPSLYGVVSSLSNPSIIGELTKRGVAISEE
jgi:serine protease Do